MHSLKKKKKNKNIHFRKTNKIKENGNMEEWVMIHCQTEIKTNTSQLWEKEGHYILRTLMSFKQEVQESGK